MHTLHTQYCIGFLDYAYKIQGINIFAFARVFGRHRRVQNLAKGFSVWL